MRYEWRGHAVVDDAFENMDISLNADKIADWWIAKFATTLELLEKEVEGIDFYGWDERTQRLNCEKVLAIIRQHKEG